PELRVNAELWEILQRTDYAAVAVVSFVCPAEPCPEPSLALRGLKNSLEDAGIGVFQGPLGDRETLIATDGGGTVTLPNHALIVTFPEETP
ncbi:MAG TPA: hypothetical protein VEI97_04530, partial [bacterium]|nr:hypothetical protein [bacterium]